MKVWEIFKISGRDLSGQAQSTAMEPVYVIGKAYDSLVTAQGDDAGWRRRVTTQGDDAGWRRRVTTQGDDAGWRRRVTTQVLSLW